MVYLCQLDIKEPSIREGLLLVSQDFETIKSPSFSITAQYIQKILRGGSQ
jgi:hypothetical protein